MKTFVLILLSLWPVLVVAQVHYINVNINQPAFVASAGNDITLCSGSGDTLHASGGISYNWSPSTGLSCTNCQHPYANPTTTTTYIVEVTGVNGCTAWDTIVVTVSPSLVANAGPDTSVCEGKSITLHASGGSGYSWSPSTGLSSTSVADPIATPSVTTTYTVTVSSGECTPSTDQITVTVLPSPPVPTITTSGSGGATLHSSSPTNNQWYRNGVLIVGATSQDYTATQSGEYTVVVIDSNGCSSTSAPFAFTSGVQSSRSAGSKMASDFSLYPNPNNGKFTFSFESIQNDNYDIELRDVLGRVVHQGHLNKFIGHYSQQFDLASYPKGFYSLSVRNGKEMVVMKVVTY